MVKRRMFFQAAFAASSLMLLNACALGGSKIDQSDAEAKFKASVDSLDGVARSVVRYRVGGGDASETLRVVLVPKVLELTSMKQLMVDAIKALDGSKAGKDPYLDLDVTDDGDTLQVKAVKELIKLGPVRLSEYVKALETYTP